jgi:hypothetical protein
VPSAVPSQGHNAAATRTFPEPERVARELLALAPLCDRPDLLAEAAASLFRLASAPPPGRTGTTGTTGREAAGARHSPNGAVPVPQRTGTTGTGTGDAAATCTLSPSRRSRDRA